MLPAPLIVIAVAVTCVAVTPASMLCPVTFSVVAVRFPPTVMLLVTASPMPVLVVITAEPNVAVVA